MTRLKLNNTKISFFAVFFLIFASGCRTHTGVGYDSGHHGSVSVGIHGNGNAAVAVGALIVGGLIGSALADAENEKKAEAEAVRRQKIEDCKRKKALAAQQAERQQPRAAQQGFSMDSLAQEIARVKQESADHSQNRVASSAAQQNTSIEQQQDTVASDGPYQQPLVNTNSAIQWYQAGKDNQCYLMSVNNGVTDIVRAVERGFCQ